MEETLEQTIKGEKQHKSPFLAKAEKKFQEIKDKIDPSHENDTIIMNIETGEIVHYAKTRLEGLKYLREKELNSKIYYIRPVKLKTLY